MKIRIVTLAKNSEGALVPLEEEYRRRLGRTCPTEFLEFKRENLKDPKGFARDWEKIKTKIGKSRVVLLDEKGGSFTSAALAVQFEKWLGEGRDLTFIIGGPEGFPARVKDEAGSLLSLSPLTFPHKLVRLLLLEALYRADDIRRGGPYHRE